MTTIQKIVATTRTAVGKGETRKIVRTQDLVPAVLYGLGKENVNLFVPKKEINMALVTPAPYKKPFEILVDGKAIKVVLADYKIHPNTALVRHVDFMRVA
jgi:large subunit ribosomal protein L25